MANLIRRDLNFGKVGKTVMRWMQPERDLTAVGSYEGERGSHAKEMKLH